MSENVSRGFIREDSSFRLGKIEESDPSAKQSKATCAQVKYGEEELFLWLGQPVKGFEFLPHFTCRSKDEEVLNPIDSKYQYTWLRNRKFSLCNGDKCISSNKSTIEVSYQCLTCLQYGNENRSYFCCPKCLSQNWKTHCKTHVITEHSTFRSPKKIPTTEETTLKELSDLQLKQSKSMKPQMEGWEKIGSGCSFFPSDSDIGHQLKLEVSSAESGKVIITALSKPVILPPPYCERRVWCKGIPNGGNTITITTYNILSDLYVHSDLYNDCPPWALEWEYRRDRLFHEIDERESDIFCLQEMEKSQYDVFWKERMKEKGYESYFTVKERMVKVGGERIDGCATFFLASKFSVTGNVTISFNTIAEMEGCYTSDQLKRLCRGNIAHVLRLSLLDSSFAFYLCNAHLYWDPKLSDVKLVQTAQLLHTLESLENSLPLPIIMCGDFNSTPDSAVYQLLCSHHVENHPDIANDPLNIIHSRGIQTFNHNLQLRSVYYDITGKEPIVTNYTDHYEGCLDYIWLFNFKPVDCTILPTKEEMGVFGELKLPNPIYVSDHLPLDGKVSYSDYY